MEKEEIVEKKNMTLRVFEALEKLGLWILEKLHLKFLAKFYTDHIEGMRYLICGGLSTVVNIVSYAVVAYTIFAGIEQEALRVTISDCVAFVIALIFAYWVNKTIVFDSKCENFKALIKEMMDNNGIIQESEPKKVKYAEMLIKDIKEGNVEL